MAVLKYYDKTTGQWAPVVSGSSPFLEEHNVDTAAHQDIRTAVTNAANAASAAQTTANGKADAVHNQAASTITAGTFAGQVVANSSGQTYSTSLLRNSKLVSAETNPTVNGEICWTYE